MFTINAKRYSPQLQELWNNAAHNKAGASHIADSAFPLDHEPRDEEAQSQPTTDPFLAAEQRMQAILEGNEFDTLQYRQ